MKTTAKSNSSLPSPIRFSAYIFAVTVFCFINWTFLKAGDPIQNNTLSPDQSIAEAIVEEADPEPVLENWMLTINTGMRAEATEQEIALSTWMIDYHVFAGTETAEEPALEEWMVNLGDWENNDFLAKK
jgi:hypothetical protein